MAIQQPLFNPDLESIRYIATNGTFEFTLDGKFKTFWLSQKEIADMFDLDVKTVNRHIRVYEEEQSTFLRNEIVQDPIPMSKTFHLTQTEGTRQVERDVECYNHEVVIDVGYRARSTQKTVDFRRFVNEVFRQRLEAEHARALRKAQHTHAGDVTQYILSGKTQSHAEKRVDLKSTFKRLSAIIIELCDASVIGSVVSREYLLLFNKAADELKTILRTKSIRDALPELQLSFLDMVEQSLILVLSNKDRMTREEILKVVDQTVKPLAEHLKTICDMAGVDVITGQKRLGGGK